MNRRPLSPGLVAYFGENYMDWVKLRQAGAISYETACAGTMQIYLDYIYPKYHSEAKAAA